VKKTLRSLALACGFMVAAEAASAAVIFDNGGPIAGGSEATGWVQADDFQLGGSATIAGAQIYIGGLPSGIGNWDGTVSYFIFADNAGAPGTLLTSGAGQNISTTDTGMPWLNDASIFQVEFDLVSAFDAAAGTTYWFGIHLSTDFNVDNIFWMDTDSATGNGQESRDGTFDNWSSNGGFERAFALFDDTTAVPEPGTLALFGSGLLGMTALRRRRRR
jgi:hypothetical protein